MNEEIATRLELMRDNMRRHHIDASIIPQADPHQSEYVASHWQVRRYFSGFNGSAGTLVLTQKSAALWTDSRYFIQAATQLEGTGIRLMKEGMPDTPSITEWIETQLPHGGTVALDGWLYSANDMKHIMDTFEKNNIKVDTKVNLIDDVWADRPDLPVSKAFLHDEKYAGQTTRAKIVQVISEVKEHNAGAILLSALDEIAWMLNLRGSDVKCNPVNIAYLYLSDNKRLLFIGTGKLTTEVKEYLHKNEIETCDYSQFPLFLTQLPHELKVLVDYNKTAYQIVSLLGSRAVDCNSPVQLLKAIKNPVQLQGFRNAMIRDGVALTQAFAEIERRLENNKLTTEIDVADIIYNYRSKQPLFFDISFDTIAGYKEHGAIVHYTANNQTNSTLKPEGLLLIDSGAQYLDGTTDITRTISLGSPTSQEKHDFTLVLKGMIALANAVFPTGTRGVQLDVLAKQFMWRDGYQYLHGTGHGIGHFLNVHEGPQTIRNNNNDTPMMPGMVTSDEPGLYKEGEYGIRCENLIAVLEADVPNQSQTVGAPFLRFETLTLFPFDKDLIDTEMLSPQEKNWINNYHKQVYHSLAPHLDVEARSWLENETSPIE